MNLFLNRKNNRKIFFHGKKDNHFTSDLNCSLNVGPKQNNSEGKSSFSKNKTENKNKNKKLTTKKIKIRKNSDPILGTGFLSFEMSDRV